MATENKNNAIHNIDPTTLSVVSNKLKYITEQLGQVILYSTQSFVTANVRDCGQTLLDAKGKIVTVSSFLPVHTLVAEAAIQGLESVFHGDYEPGDYILANDPYIVAGGHLPDWNFIRPIFYKGEHIGFLQAKTHVTDTGGFLPGGYAPGAYDIIAEGLNIPPIKIIKKGVLQKEIWSLILRNNRNPAEVDMDTMLTNGAMEQAENQIVALCNKYGVETVKAVMSEIIESAGKYARSVIKKIPDGVYHGESACDWDGVTDKPVYVRVDTTIKDDTLTFDFSKSDPQTTFINSTLGVTQTGSTIALCYFDPKIPLNSGTLSAINYINPLGTVVNPRYPATVGASQVSCGNEILEACLNSLSLALPELSVGGWCKHMCPINIGTDTNTIDPRTGNAKSYWTETFGSDAGGGGVKGFDGWHGVNMLNVAGNFMRPNMEIFESFAPYMITKYSVPIDREGPGEFRGSPGMEVSYINMSTPDMPPAQVMTGNSNGMLYPPQGVNGGEAGPPVEQYIISTTGEKRVLRTFDLQPCLAGEEVVTISTGGGGWGSPLNRKVEKVQYDVIEGRVSIERAKERYGIILDPETFEVNLEATEKLRKELKASKSA